MDLTLPAVVVFVLAVAVLLHEVFGPWDERDGSHDITPHLSGARKETTKWRSKR